MYNRARIGELLVKNGDVTEADVTRALAVQRDKGGLLGEILIDADAATPAQVCAALAEQLDYPLAIELDVERVDLTLLSKLNLGFCRDNHVLPVERDGDCLLVATDDPLNVEVLDEIRFLLQEEVAPLVTPSPILVNAINLAFERKSRLIDSGIEDFDEETAPATEEEGVDIKDLIDAGDDDEAPVIKFVNSLFVQAVRERASDIHIEPGDKDLNVRFRVDGVLKMVAAPPKRFHSSIVTRIKIQASLNIAEKRLPQDGRIRIKIAGKDIDIRVATAPMVHGEKITM